MKPILNLTTFILLLGLLPFTSCKKEPLSEIGILFPPPPPPPPAPPLPPLDSLTGREFIFTNLPWTLFTDAGGDEVFCSISNRPDLFYLPNRPMEVSIRLDTSTDWLPVPRLQNPIPANSGYLYQGGLSVSAYPINYSLIGGSASIKVKFL